MAKRKRLTPPRFDTASGVEAAPETKSAFPSYPLGIAPTRRMPIADVAGEAAGRAALDEMSQTLGAARAEGRLIQWLPLEEIDESYLVRDRIATDEEEMQALVDSLRDRGQQTAIEVADLGEGTHPRWGLISGWRRLAALRRLAAETGAPGQVLAIPRMPRNAAEAYRAMVEENEIRVGLSHYERARIVARAADAGVYDSDSEALKGLFGAATRSRRSKIGSFVRIVRALDDALRFPTSISERSGLALSQALEVQPGFDARLRAALSETEACNVETEAALIASHLADTRLARKVNSEPAGAMRRLRDGLECRERPDGTLLLSGALLSEPDFRNRLMRFLKTGS